MRKFIKCLFFFIFTVNVYGAPPHGGNEFHVAANQCKRYFLVPMEGGKFAVIWEDATTSGKYAQIFDSTGTASTGRLSIDDIYTLHHSRISTFSNGDLILVFRKGSVGNWDLYGQILDSFFNAKGDEFRISSYEGYSEVSVFPNDNFVVIWSSYNEDSDNNGLYGQIFDSEGNKLGNKFRINKRGGVSVATLKNGNFVVVWMNYDGDCKSPLYYQIFDSLGNKIGEKFLVDDFSCSGQSNLGISVLRNGNFVINWVDGGYTQDPVCCTKNVYGQIFDEYGNKVGDRFKCNPYDNSSRYYIVSSPHNDYFAIITVNVGNETISAQLFDFSGNKIGDSFSIVSTSHDIYFNKAATAAAIFNHGSLVVVWTEKSGYWCKLYGRAFDSFVHVYSEEIMEYLENEPLNFDSIEVLSFHDVVKVTMTLSEASVGRLNEDESGDAKSTYDSTLGKWQAWGLVDDVNGLLKNLVFTPEVDYVGNFTIDVFAEDGKHSSFSNSINVIGISVNKPPVISVNAKDLIFPCCANTNSIVIDGSIKIHDADNSNLQSAIVKITRDVVLGDDFLDFTDQNGIEGSYIYVDGGILKLSGSSSIENYQNALRSVKYRYRPEDNNAERKHMQVSFVVNDGLEDSVEATRNIKVLLNGAFGDDDNINDEQVDLSYPWKLYLYIGVRGVVGIIYSTGICACSVWTLYRCFASHKVKNAEAERLLTAN